MDSRLILTAVVVLLVGLAAGFVAASSGMAASSSSLSVMLSKEVAGQRVVDYLAANDVAASVLVVTEESGLYKVTVRQTSNGVASDLYITKDGNMLLQPGISNLNTTTAQLLARRAWFDCLGQRGLRMFGSTATNSTLLQLQAFGGTQFVDRIYIGCEGDRAQQCVDAGVTEVPLFVYGNQTYTGVKTMDFLVNLTGCVPVLQTS